MQFVFAGCVLDGDKREFTRHSEPIAMEPQVFDLLLFLLQNRDRVVSRDDLIASVWNGRIVSESTLSTRITAARKAIGDTGEDQILIKTYPRKGIRFVGDLQMVGVSRPNEREQGPAAPSSFVQRMPPGSFEWGGHMCLPREVYSVRPGELRFRPAPEAVALTAPSTTPGC